MSNLEYDNEWELTLSNNGYTELDVQYGAFTGNGKIAFYNSMKDISNMKMLTSGNVQFNQIGKYTNNTLETFSVNNIKLITNSEDTVTYTLVHQKLMMDTGAVETKMNVGHSTAGNIEINSTVIPLRQYPYCTLQKVEVIPQNDISSLDIFHEIKSCATISNEEYNNNVIYNENIYSNKGLYLLNAVGNITNMSCKVCASSCYFFDSSTSEMYNLGYNIFNDKSLTYQKYRLNNLVNQNNYIFYILSAVMTSYDFPDPLEEVKRILLNIAFKDNDTNTLIIRLLTDNKAMWDEMWKGDIEIVPKAMINGGELDRVMKTKQYIRLSLFNIFACLRSVVNTEINPLNLSYIDMNGNVFFDGDLWLIPTLIFLKPQIARVMLEFKYKLIEQAMQLSASFGYKGSKFPYKNDIVGYKNVYWDVISPLHIFNNANICINVWNYYRVTLDKEWLLNKGYIIMKNIVDFLASYIVYSEGVYIIPHTMGLGQLMGDNHAFTVNAVLLSFKHTIEASYILNYIPNRKWLDIVLYLQVPIILNGLNVDVIKYHETYSGSTNIDILDNLAVLIPYYSSIFFNDYSQRNNSAILRNLNFYSTRIDTQYQTNVLNNLIIASLYGVLSQTSTEEMPTFYDKLDKIFDENIVGYWGHMNIKNSTTLGNDVSLNGFMVFLILTCICGLKIRGSTAPSNVVIENYRIQDSLGTYMPSTWSYINIGAIGNDETFIHVSNQLPYIS